MATAGVLFQGRSVIVTGGASGIGRATALRFGEEGAKVCIADQHLDAAQQVARQIVSRGGEAFACHVDVSVEADNERMVAEALQRHGGLDIAYLNAGFGGVPLDVLNGKVADFDRIMAVNVRGCYLGLRSVARVIRSGGAIVVTASIGSLVGIGFNPAYAASKHAVLGLVTSLSEALAAQGVRINAVCPGSVGTPMIGVPIRDLGVAPDQLPMVRFRGRAAPEHVAETVLFLASHRAGGITGSHMVVDAGLTGSLVPPPRKSDGAKGRGSDD